MSFLFIFFLLNKSFVDKYTKDLLKMPEHSRYILNERYVWKMNIKLQVMWGGRGERKNNKDREKERDGGQKRGKNRIRKGKISLENSFRIWSDCRIYPAPPQPPYSFHPSPTTQIFLLEKLRISGISDLHSIIHLPPSLLIMESFYSLIDHCPTFRSSHLFLAFLS